MPDVPLVRARTSAPTALPTWAGESTAGIPNPPVKPDRIERAPASGQVSGVPHGFGAGVIVGASAEAGFLGGLGATASAGAGIFSSGTRPVTAGSFAGAGAFAGIAARNLKTASSADPVNVTGAFAGAGIGAFVTNAASVQQLGGIAQTYSLNLGVGPLKISVQAGASGGTYVGSVSVGPGVGLDVSRYPTQTVTSAR